jgi:hypothetical protein
MKPKPSASIARRARYERAFRLLERAQLAFAAAESDQHEKSMRVQILRLVLAAIRRSDIPARNRAKAARITAKVWRAGWERSPKP